MSLVVWSLWINTKNWDISSHNINVMYKDKKSFIFIDQYLLGQNKIDTIFSIIDPIKRVYLDYPYIYFLTRNIDTPFLSYNLEIEKFNYYDLSGVFSDFSPSSKFLLALSNYSNSKSYNLQDGSSVEVYGYKIVEFAGKNLYIDKNNNLRDLKSDKIIMENVLNISNSTNYLIIFKTNKAIILDNEFNQIRELKGNFLDGFIIDIDGDNKDEIIVYDNYKIYLFRDSDMEIIASLRDSINCVMILDYNSDGSYDLLVSTKRELKLYEQMP
ncbi:MAG: hypothetical protein ABIL37_06080, partial [candidate division WOR-3 bacterium]